MNARSLLLPLVLASALGAVPAQELHATLLLRGIRSEIEIDESLVAAMLNEPACLEAITKSSPTGKDWASFRAGVHTPRAGTQRVELSIARTGGNAGTDAAPPKAVIDAAVRHLRSRIDTLFFEGPQRLLTRQREELANRHRESVVEQAMLRARIEAARSGRQRAEQRLNETRTRLEAVRLEVAIEERSHEQLKRLQAENAEARAVCRSRHGELVQKKAQSDANLQQLVSTAQQAPDKAEIVRLGAEISRATTEVAVLGREVDDANARATDVQRMLTVVLEQLPTSLMALQRAKAQAEVLEVQAQRAAVELEVADKLLREAAELEARAEQLGIDVAVTRTLLQEVQDKLARLQPLHIEVLYRQD